MRKETGGHPAEPIRPGLAAEPCRDVGRARGAHPRRPDELDPLALRDRDAAAIDRATGAVQLFALVVVDEWLLGNPIAEAGGVAQARQTKGPAGRSLGLHATPAGVASRRPSNSPGDGPSLHARCPALSPSRVPRVPDATVVTGLGDQSLTRQDDVALASGPCRPRPLDTLGLLTQRAIHSSCVGRR